MSDSNRSARWLAVAVLALVVAAILLTPLEWSLALMVALLGAGAVTGALTLVPEPRDRALLLKLFFAALLLRVALALVAYATGLADALGGADDIGWRASWIHSRYWRGWFGHELYSSRQGLLKQVFPDGFADLYKSGSLHNQGYHIFSSYFFYILDERSQVALAMVNCVMGAIVPLFVYKAAREFFSEKAGALAAWAAVLLPSFVAWSILTIKETWVMVFEIAVFYLVWRCARQGKKSSAAWAAVCIVLSEPFRFYVAWILAAASFITLRVARAQRPLKTTLTTLAMVAGCFLVLNAAGVVHLDLPSLVSSQIEDLSQFRTFVTRGHGSHTAVKLDYDIRTPAGALAMLGVGSVYLLFSPFPWQFHSARELVALPDVLIWWWLVAAFIVPGIRYTWKRQPQLLISIAAFVLPLVLIYSMSFGNIGLAYRQRAQLMPFLLLLAAAGYEARAEVYSEMANRLRRARLLTLAWLHGLRPRPLAENVEGRTA